MSKPSKAAMEAAEEIARDHTYGLNGEVRVDLLMSAKIIDRVLSPNSLRRGGEGGEQVSEFVDDTRPIIFPCKHGNKGICPQCLKLDLIDAEDEIERLKAEVAEHRAHVAKVMKQKDDMANEYRRQIAELKDEIGSLKRGEFICAKCGIRKDDEHEKGDF